MKRWPYSKSTKFVAALMGIIGVAGFLALSSGLRPVSPSFLRSKPSAPPSHKKLVPVSEVLRAPPEPPKSRQVQLPQNLPDLKPQVSSSLKGFGEGGADVGGGFAEDGGQGQVGASKAMAKSAVERAARVSQRTEPQYPSSAREKNVSGYVVLEILVSAGGVPEEIRVLQAEPPGVFDAAAREAVRTWRFEPAMASGQAVASWLKQKMRFELQ
jgi:protein TonB